MLCETWVRGSSTVSQPPSQVHLLTAKPLWWPHNGTGSPLGSPQHSKKGRLSPIFYKRPSFPAPLGRRTGEEMGPGWSRMPL